MWWTSITAESSDFGIDWYTMKVEEAMSCPVPDPACQISQGLEAAGSASFHAHHVRARVIWWLLMSLMCGSAFRVLEVDKSCRPGLT